MAGSGRLRRWSEAFTPTRLTGRSYPRLEQKIRKFRARQNFTLEGLERILCQEHRPQFVSTFLVACEARQGTERGAGGAPIELSRHEDVFLIAPAYCLDVLE